jgi:flavin reductase (DIM6/NTAB) family NADH-FMN oxidoreductase RutF
MIWAEAPDPPLLLTTLRKEGTARQRIATDASFGISVLDVSQAQLTWQFANRNRSAAERFEGVRVTIGPIRKVPLLMDALAAFECDVEATYPFGQHDIVVGRVVWAATGDEPDLRPVIHYAKRLWQLVRETTTRPR